MHHKWKSYDAWFLRYGARQTFFLSFWVIFCPFIPLTTRKIQILKKWKKMPGDIITLHKCNKNHDYMPYCSWDMVHDRCNFYFPFWSLFCPLTPPPASPPCPNSLKNQNLKKKKKKHLEISLFYTCVPKIMFLWCTVPKIWWATDGRKDGKKWHIEVGAPPKNRH